MGDGDERDDRPLDFASTMVALMPSAALSLDFGGPMGNGDERDGLDLDCAGSMVALMPSLP